MKCDIVVYSKTTAIGLFYFSKRDGHVYVMFIYEADTYDGNNSPEWEKEILDKIIALGDTCEENESVVSEIKAQFKEGDVIYEESPECPVMHSVAALYARLLSPIHKDLVPFLNKRKIIYTDLIRCCQTYAAWGMISDLKDSEDEEDKKQAFQCLKILAEEFNDAVAYYELAYYYQEGIGVEKSREARYPLVKKAAELGDKEAIEWIKREDENK